MSPHGSRRREAGYQLLEVGMDGVGIVALVRQQCIIYFGMTYDAGDRLRSATWWAPQSGTIPFLSITYDDLGRRFGMNNASAYTYLGFDDVSRLKSIEHQFGGGTGNVIENLYPDSADQIVVRARNNDDYISTSAVAVNRPYAVNGLNQYTTAGPATFAYDANGNLITDGMVSYVYDAENRLVSSSQYGMTLAYDPLGRLWQTTSSILGNSQFLHDGDHIVLEYDGSNGGIRRRFMWGPGIDEPLVEDSGGAMNFTGTRFLHADHQGSIIAVADGWGTRQNVNGYDEYGIPNSNNWGRFQYTGQAWLADLGMYYYKARMYSPTLGRFMQTDPIGYKDQINLYAYVGDDPVDGRDPSGLCGPLCGAGIGLAVEAVFQASDPKIRSDYAQAFSSAASGDFSSATVQAGGHVADLAVSAAAGAVGAVGTGKAVQIAEKVAGAIGVTSKVGTSAAQLAGASAAQSATGVGSRVASNVANGRSAGDGVSTAAKVGAVIGGPISRAGSAIAAAAPGVASAASAATRTINSAMKKEATCMVKTGDAC